MKNFNDTIGNRTRYLPTCKAVPQPTAPPRTPLYRVVYIISLSNQIYLFSFMYIPMDVTSNTRFLPLRALPALLES
jgi:hypothetical protein